MTRHIALQNATAFDIRQLDSIMGRRPAVAQAGPRDVSKQGSPSPQRTDNAAFLGAWGEWRGL
jgi:hypothetical protein